MRKARTDSRTRQRLLDAAQDLMLTKGYTATSVDDVCEAAGLTKGSFFHYFKGKEHLGSLVVERYYAASQEMSRAASYHRKKDPLDRVLAHVDCFIEASRDPVWKGCLLGTFVQELSQTHPQIRAVCAACLSDLAKSFKLDLDAAKKKHKVRARWSTQSLAEHLIAVAQGGVILAKAKQDRKVFETSLLHFKEYLKRLFEM